MERWRRLTLFDLEPALTPLIRLVRSWQRLLSAAIPAFLFLRRGPRATASVVIAIIVVASDAFSRFEQFDHESLALLLDDLFEEDLHFRRGVCTRCRVEALDVAEPGQGGVGGVCKGRKEGSQQVSSVREGRV